MVIYIIQGKGNKDRIVPMSASLLKMLEEYYLDYKPKEYMFNGQFGLKYSDTSINKFIKELGKKAGIKKRLHAHLGRHSCFSQMLANGIELALIQKVAGHKDIKTTAIYAKITPPTISRLQAYDF
jgi:site-specific recombinase XerD